MLKALSRTDLTMTVQNITRLNLTTRNGSRQQTLSSGDLSSSGSIIVVVTHEGNANCLRVPVGGMSTHYIPTATLINITITTD
ncbi:hypothetical protein CVS40_5479 [Lucilia cuprina]|nr:hypothetical protein CVS40_5479 [Lucilia cuprina]